MYNGKCEKIQVYYVVIEADTSIKPPIDETKVKHYIHSEASQGLWVAPRDLSLTESLSAAQADIEITMQFTANWNDKLVAMWNDVRIEFRNKVYKIEGKPDQLNYLHGDIIIKATEVTDTDNYSGEVYEDE